jgi:hypothetical protein
MEGYSVDTATLSDFRDNALGPLADDVSRIHQATSQAAVSPSIYPDTARSREIANQHQTDHGEALNNLHVFKNRIEDHRDRLTRTRRNYDGAEADIAHAVASLPSSTNQTQAGAGTTQAVRSAFMVPKVPTIDTTPAVTSGSGSIGVGEVYAAFQHLEKIFASFGRAYLVRPIKDFLDATIRDPDQLHHAAVQHDQIRHVANTIRTNFFNTELAHLSSNWAGQASGKHLQSTIAKYQAHFDANDAFNKEQSEKLHHNAQVQNSQNQSTTAVMQWGVTTLIALIITGSAIALEFPIFAWVFVLAALACAVMTMHKMNEYLKTKYDQSRR